MRYTRWSILALLVPLAIVATACGGAGSGESDVTSTGDRTEAGSPETEASSEVGSEAASGGQMTFEQVYAEVEGLDAEARKERLITLAEEAGGSVNVYSSMNGDEGPESVALFEEQTGLTAEFYRASATDVLNRVIQESDANYDNPADVITANGSEIVILQREGLLGPVNTIAAEELPEGGVTDHYAWTYVNVFTPLWNTDLVDQAPKTWSDVLQNYPGQLAFEVGDWDWLANVVPVIMKQQGISEEAAIDMVRQAMREAAGMVDGHTALAQFVAAGQYDLGVSAYHNTGVDLADEGAPVAWEPPVDPLIVRPNAGAVNVDAPNPAGAVLFLDFFLTDAQPIMAKHGRQPANLNAEGGSLPPEYPSVVVDLEQMVDEQERWQTLYQELVDESGLPVEE